MDNTSLVLWINGKPVTASGDKLNWTLVRFLRYAQGLTGVKQSCDNEGSCGACTVIINGQAKRACLEKVSRLADARITTIESLQEMPEGIPHPLLQTVIQDGIFQCGYCSSGALLAAKALLDKNLEPSQSEILKVLSPVVCRCAGLNRMDRSVSRAAAILRGDQSSTWTMEDTLNERDILEKLTGKLKYTDDLSFPTMLFGKAKRSPLPHATVKNVDISKAEKIPGVVKVLTAGDIPGINRFGLLVRDQPIFCDEEVRYVGDCLALVVAETIEAAQAGLDAIELDLIPLPVIRTPEEGLSPDAPVLHPYLHEQNPSEHPNVLKHHAIRKGDIDKGFAEADVVIEGTYKTPFIDHAFMELECSIGYPEDDGTITVYCGSQGPTSDRAQVAEALGLAEEKVRIAHMYVGGGFGGKEDVTGQVLAGIAAKVVGRPVKILFTREESLKAHHKRHAMTMHYKMGATNDGRIVAAEIKILGDTGAYASTGEAVLFRSATFACGPYIVPNVKVDTYAVHTNNPSCGAFRGFGGAQTAFASEVHLQKIIDALKMDPYEFRLKNAVRLGDATITGHVLDRIVGADYDKCLSEVYAAVKNSSIIEPEKDERIGIGFAGAYKNVGLGSGIPDGAGASVTLQKDGSFLLKHGAADIGQGSNDVMTIIVAHTLGIPRKSIFVHTGDTKYDPIGGMTTASRATFVSGNAALKAAEKIRAHLWGTVSSEFEVADEDLEIRSGVFVNKKSGESIISLVELANSGECFSATATYDAPVTNPVPKKSDPWPMVETSSHSLHFAYDFGVQAAIVAVNTVTGAFRILKIIAAHDVGKAISLRNTIGQLEGATIQGLGFATSEAFIVKDGFPQTTRFSNLGLYRLNDIPEIQAILVEEPHELGPLGAKGMGELAISPTSPAVVNAIHDAAGIWIEDLPITREKILTALNSKA